MIEKSLRDVYGDYLVEAGENMKDLVVLDTDLSYSTRTFKFAKAFPERFFNMGIAEQNAVGTALGLAISGKIPIVSGFSVFTTGRAWEFIRLACHDNLNVKIIATHSGFIGEDGSTHNALEDISLMASLPNLNILVPSDNIELLKILEYTLNTKGTFYIRLPRDSFPRIHSEDYRFRIGKPDVLKEGDDICIIGTGYGSNLAFNLVSSIEKQLDITVKIINFPTIKPIDNNSLLNEIKKVKGIILVEEHNIYCGFGSIIARIISENYPKMIKFVGVNDSFGQSGKRETLLDAHGLNEGEFLRHIKNILNASKISV
jgi:transketolase